MSSPLVVSITSFASAAGLHDGRKGPAEPAGSEGGPCGLAVRVPPLRRSVELRTGCDQRYATKRCLQLHYLANASSTGPRSGTLCCGPASERGPARSRRDQAVLHDTRTVWPLTTAVRLISLQVIGQFWLVATGSRCSACGQRAVSCRTAAAVGKPGRKPVSR